MHQIKQRLLKQLMSLSYYHKIGFYLEFRWDSKRHCCMLPLVSLGTASWPDRWSKLLVYLSVHIQGVNMRTIHVIPKLQALLLSCRDWCAFNTSCIVSLSRKRSLDVDVVSSRTTSGVVSNRPGILRRCLSLDSGPVEFIIQRLSPQAPITFKCAVIDGRC